MPLTRQRDASESSSDCSYRSEEDASHVDLGRTEAGADFVNVELEFFDPSEIDYHGLKMLLRSLLDGEDFQGCSDLVEAILRQVRPGLWQSQIEDCLDLCTSER